MSSESMKTGSIRLPWLGTAAALGFLISTAVAGAQGAPELAGQRAHATANTKARVATPAKPAVVSTASAVPTGVPQDDGAAPQPAAKPVSNGGTPYFVEFRSRYAQSYGHTYAVHGRVGQKITKKDVIGLHPATESTVPWMIGHLIPVVSETGASDGDAEEQYVSARYRVLLTKAEYAKLREFMSKLQTKSPLWHAAIYNCNAFVGDIARYVGLEVPSHFLYPKEFITELRVKNKGRTRVAGTAPLYAATP
jgi:hypothetical protein